MAAHVEGGQLVDQGHRRVEDVGKGGCDDVSHQLDGTVVNVVNPVAVVGLIFLMTFITSSSVTSIRLRLQRRTAIRSRSLVNGSEYTCGMPEMMSLTFLMKKPLIADATAASFHINLSLKTVQLSPPIFGHFCE